MIHSNASLRTLPQYYAQRLNRFATRAKRRNVLKCAVVTQTPGFGLPQVLDPRNDVEAKNALAVKTVKAHGVSVIDDLYTAVTDVCGKVYKNCSLCDDESKYHPGGACGFHYTAEGWELLANQTASYIAKAL